MNRRITVAALLSLSSLLSACGGGDSPVTIPPNQAPQFTSAGAVTLVENAALSYQATATDADGNPLTFSISGGPDAARFSINATGLLNFLAAADADNPTDADGDNVYQVTLSVSDGKTTASLPLTVTVTNSREGIAVRRISTGFNKPVAMANIPGDARIFVAEEGRNIYYFDPATGTRTLYAQMDGRFPPVHNITMDIAVSPGFATDGLLYYSFRGDMRYHALYYLERSKVVAGTSPASTLIDSWQAGSEIIELAGWLDFGPDGQLYFGMGAASPPTSLDPQSDTSPYGKIFRVRRNAPGATPQYSFELAAKGVQRPASATFVGNTLLVGDQWAVTKAEINRFDITGAVANFGWPYRDGSAPNPAITSPEPAGLVGPALEIPRGPANATGPKESKNLIMGPIYNGPIASLAGQLIVGDSKTGSIWTTDANQLLSTMTTLTAAALAVRKTDFAPDVGTIDAVTAFLVTNSGKLLILDYDGEIFEVVAAT